MKYTLLLANGRLIDPKNGTDMIADIGINGRQVVEIGKDLDKTQTEKLVDVRGKWVIPGVIDPHVHVSSWIGDFPGLKMMAKEGVITALDMAGPPSDVIANVRDHGSGMNIACLDAFCVDIDSSADTDLSDEDIKKRINDSVEKGAFGIKLLGGHYPLSPETTRKAIQFAAEDDIYVAFHVGTTSQGSHLEGMREAVELAGGYPIHIAHINSYCRGAIKNPFFELSDAIDLLQDAPNVWSESYLSIYNGTSAKCVNGEILSHVTKRCCRTRGFSDDEKGLGEAIKTGFGNVVKFQGGENVLVTGEEGYKHWKKQDSDVTISFPVNLPQIQFSLATMKDENGNFLVDALCTDGGGIPRNTTVRQGLDLVHYGALSPTDYVQKVSTNAARMLGLINKGHLSPGADSDITVIDPEKGRAYMGIAAGKIIMLDGVVLGKGGIFITTKKGEQTVQKSGVNYLIIDTAKALKLKTKMDD